MNGPRLVGGVIHRLPQNSTLGFGNVPLARSLFQIELGSEIPESLYEAVAEVLNWVYQLAQTEQA